MSGKVFSFGLDQRVEMKKKNKLSPPFICDLVNDESNVPHHTRSHYNITESEEGNLKVEKEVSRKCHQLRK